MAEKVKKITCPRCKRHLTLEGFEVVEHEDDTFTAEPSVICSWEDCGVNFFITRSKVELVNN
jgi:hypothetical protein